MAVTRAPGFDDALATGMRLQVVGQTARRNAMSRVVVLGRSDPGAGAALAAVLAGTVRIPNAVTANFPTVRRRRALFVLDAVGDERLLISTGVMGQVVVSAGSWPVVLPLLLPTAEPIPTSDRRKLAQDLDLFCAVVDAAAGGVDMELWPTGLTVDQAVSAVGRAGRAVADLVRRRPGRMYDAGAESADARAISFADIGGQDAAKAELEMIFLAIRDPSVFAAWGSRPPRGVLLYGPPGTGKTMLARARARESGARFIHVRATDIVSKWYGEAERRLQDAFDWARSERPTVMFFDEIDALARSRDDAHEATHRIVSTFLENLDGLQATDGVIVLGATNRPEAVDEALTRPGRFDRLVEVPLPAPEGRRAIFRIHMTTAERKAGRQLFDEFSEVQWDALIAATDGFSGADIGESVRRVLEARVRARSTTGMVGAEEVISSAAGVRRPF